MSTKAEKMTLAFTSEHAAAVRQAVETGGYATSSEVVREAMRLWLERKARRRVVEERLGQLWDEGIASGPGVPMTTEEVMAYIHKRAGKKV